MIVDLHDAIDAQQIQALTRTLARILVTRALMERGIEPANENA